MSVVEGRVNEGYAPVNGVDMYWRSVGEGGTPLVVVRGGLHDAGWDGSQRPRGRLAILPGRTHYDLFRAPELAGVVTDFLDA